MSDVLEAAGAACLFLVGSELVTRLWGEDKTLDFARGLAVLVVLLGLVGALFTGEWDLELPQAQGEAAGQELRSFVEEEAQAAVEEELGRSLLGLLEAGGVTAEKIQVETDIGEEGGIECTGVELWFAYPSQEERALALLESQLAEEGIVDLPLEVAQADLFATLSESGAGTRDMRVACQVVPGLVHGLDLGPDHGSEA